MTQSLRAAMLIATSLVAACGLAGEAQDDKDLATKVDSLEERVAGLEAQMDSSVDLEVGDSAFAIGRMDIGSIAVSLEGVTDTPGGARVALSIGNLTAASIEGLQAQVAWDRPATPGQRVDQPSTAVGTIALARSAPAGRWTRATITIPNVMASQIGSVHLAAFTYESIILR